MLRRNSVVKSRFITATCDSRKDIAIAEAAAPVLCELLEARTLLTTYTYQAPSGTTAVYLEGDSFNPGRIKVRLNSETAPFVSPDPLTNQNGMSIIQAPTGSSGFLFVDKVAAELKPIADLNGDHGIKVEAPSPTSAATLRIDRRTLNDDQYMQVTQSSSTQTTVRVFNNEQGNFVSGDTRMGSGVTNLTLRTNDVAATDYYPTFGGGTDVVVPFLADDIFLTVDTGSGRYDRIWLGTDESFTDSFLHEEATVITGAGRCQVTVRGQDGQPQTRARIDYGPRGAAGTHTGHNKLHVDLNGVATLAQLAGANHTVVVEEVVLDGFSNAKPATLYVEDPSTIDDLDEFDNGLAFVQPTADGTQVPLWNVSANSAASVEGDSTIGTFTVDGQANFTSTSVPSTVTTFEVTGDVPSSNGAVTAETGSGVTALSTSRIGALTIGDGALFTLAERTGTPSHGSTLARVLRLKSLFIHKAPSAPTAVLDLTDNAMVIDYTSTSPIADVEDYITNAYAAAAWTGDGLSSSTAAAVAGTAAPQTGVGYAEQTDLFSGSATWEGQTVDTTSVLVKYTYYGDANMDGAVNLQDFNRLAANFGGTGKRWTQGDFNYDNGVNLQDFNRLAANFGVGAVGAEYDDYTTQELQDMLPD